MELLSEVLIIFFKALFVMFVIILHLAAFTIWVERKGSALIQDRIGANRASLPLIGPLFGIWNTLIADPVKALTKEDFVPKGTSQFMHSLAPFLAVVPVLVSYAVIPFGPPMEVGSRVISLQLADLGVGVLYLLAVGSLAVYGVVLAGWVSNNKFSLLGGLRASAQLISYEVTLGLSIVGLIAIYGTLDLNQIIQFQKQFLWGLFLNPIGFILFFVSLMAETKRAPFDLPESESELVAGYMTEYSGMKFLLFWLGEFSEIAVASSIVVVLFLGGYHLPFIDLSALKWFVSIGGVSINIVPLFGVVVFITKVALLCVLQVIIRWTLPRFRYDQLMDLCWKIMLPLALINVFISALLAVYLRQLGVI